MDIKGHLRKVKTWLWIVFAGSFATVCKYTLENGKPPEWLSLLIRWVFGVSADAFDAFTTKTVLLWSALVLGLMLALAFGVIIVFLGKRYLQAELNLKELTLSNVELMKSYDSISDESKKLNVKCTGLAKSLADSSKAMDQLKEERDKARQEVERIKSNAKKVPFTMDGLIGANAFAMPEVSRLLPKGARVSPRKEVVKAKAEVLKAVMLCTRNQPGADISEIGDLVTIGSQELEKILSSLMSDGYVSSVQYGFRPRYQLTAKANMHFKSVENNYPSELDFT